MSGSYQQAPTVSQTLASGVPQVFATGNGYYPKEGSRVVSLAYNWTSQAAYAEDGSQLEAHGVLSTPQTAYIDNSLNSQTVQLTVAGTGQVINCPANSQGFFPLFFSGIPSFNIATLATGTTTPTNVAATTRVFLLNFPQSGGVWHV